MTDGPTDLSDDIRRAYEAAERELSQHGRALRDLAERVKVRIATEDSRALHAASRLRDARRGHHTVRSAVAESFIEDLTRRLRREHHDAWDVVMAAGHKVASEMGPVLERECPFLGENLLPERTTRRARRDAEKAPKRLVHANARGFADRRIKAGLLQAEVAHALGIARTSVVAIEAGERGVSAEELHAFERLLTSRAAAPPPAPLGRGRPRTHHR